jgi:hypothetical protein
MKPRRYQWVVIFLMMIFFHASATVRYVNVNNPGPASPYTSWVTAATNIQDAVDAANPGDQIWVTNGVYQTGGRTVNGDSLTNRVAVTKAVTVQSVNGPTVTTIQGYQIPGTITGDGAVRCVYLTNSALLSGFTLTNGATSGAAAGNPKLEQVGGGAYCNSASSVVSNCVLVGNAAYTWGGGAIYGLLKNSVIRGNAAASGGGTYLCKLYNCIVVSNTAASSGGGATRGTLNNCTIIGNSASTYGGGVDGSSDGVLNNCIVFFNNAPANANYFRGSFNAYGSVNYCCTIPFSTNGIDNITNDPTFVNAAAGDYHLQSNSPCINAGNNAYVSGTNDLDGNPRIKGGTVDAGAYEYQTPTSVISYAWLQQYGLPTDGSVDYLDLDGTGMNDWQKWIAGLNPTNPASILAMLPLVPTNSPSGLVVVWQSVNNRIYYLQRGTDLLMQPAFSAIQSNILGQAGTTSYTDTNAVGSGPYFYRVGVQ